MKSDYLVIDGKKFNSRLIMGTSLYPNLDVMNKSLEISETQIITVAIRRLNLSSKGFFLDQLNKDYYFLPNTAGCFTQKEAILTAELARETLQTNWIKLELISDKEMSLTEIEKALYQTKNRSRQDPLNFPIKLTNKLGHLNSLVTSNDFPPTNQDELVRKELTAEVENHILKYQKLVSQDLKYFNEEFASLNLDYLTVK